MLFLLANAPSLGRPAAGRRLDVQNRPLTLVRALSLGLVGTSLLAACGHPTTASLLAAADEPGTQVSRSRQKADLTVVPDVQSGGYKTMAVVNNYTKASINHLVIHISRMNDGVEEPLLDDLGNPVQVDLLNSDLDSPITFSNLFLNTTYRIRCLAYKAPGEAAKDLISTMDESSYLDVSLTNDDRPTIANLKVKLIDVEFSGQGTAAGITVLPGGFAEAGGTVTIIKRP